MMILKLNKSQEFNKESLEDQVTSGSFKYKNFKIKDDASIEDEGEQNLFDVKIKDLGPEGQEVDISASMKQGDPTFNTMFKSYQQNSNKFNQFFDQKQESVFSNRNHRRSTQATDQVCVDEELYVRFMNKAGTTASFVVNDIKVRKSDRTVYFAGTFDNDNTANYLNYCFLMRLAMKDGAILNSAYLDVTNTATRYTKCNAIAISQNDYPEIVAVGESFLTKSSVLLVSTFQDFSSPVVKLWSRSPSGAAPLGAGSGFTQIATDVAITFDGGIFVTGYVTGWSVGSNDCFIMRLASRTLEKIFVKSFGTTNSEQCVSIHVSNMYDYIYVGGNQINAGKTEMVFFKFDIYADTVTRSRFIRDNGANNLEMRRMIVTPGQPLNIGTDVDGNNMVYFCGHFNTNQDIIFGRMTNLFGGLAIYKYGSTGTEVGGDCALSIDGRQFIGTFGTSHTRPKNGAVTDMTYTPTSLPSLQSASVPNPADNPTCFNCAGSDWCCSNLPYVPQSAWYSYTPYTTACIADHKNNYMIPYLNEYNSNVYSWTSCTYYQFDYNALTCIYQHDDPFFPGCNTVGGGNNYFKSSGGFGPTSHGCDQNNYKAAVNAYIADGKLFRKDYYLNLMATVQLFRWGPYTFCDFVTGNNDDDFKMIFEQDCRSNFNQFDWFIYKVDTTDFANTNSIPHEAAYFGDETSHEVPTAIAMDEFGYIYIAGTTTSASGAASDFGIPSGQLGLLYAKTHNSIVYEIRKSYAGDPNQTPGILNKRFVEPKKYKNSHGITFNTNYVGSVTNAATTITRADAINEIVHTTNLPTLKTTFVADFGHTNTFYGKSFTAITDQLTFYVDRLVSFSINGPTHCSGVRKYEDKLYTYNAGLLGANGVTVQNATQPNINKEIPVIKGPTTIAEGIYYFDSYRVNTGSYSYSTSSYVCPDSSATSYWDYYDYPFYESLQRFEISVRIKIVVNDPSIDPPYFISKLPDIKPTVGFQNRYVLTPATYFGTPCTYTKLRKTKNTQTDVSDLPYWAIYYEQNNTLIMYPPDRLTGPQLSLEYFCCNAIDQCESNSFIVTPIDTQPTVSLSTSKYTIQFDSKDGVGQHWTWSSNLPFVSDIDIETTFTDVYLHQDHNDKIQITFSVPPFVGITMVDNVGQIFGQTFSGSTWGTNTLSININSYSYNQVVTITYVLNRMPEYTATGLAYVFADIDPSNAYATTFFDQFFPWLKDDTGNQVYVDTSTWFNELDGDLMTYACTYSDGTARPNWIGYDTISGELRGFPKMADSSELINLRITAFDSKEGSYSYFKTILVNAPPKVLVTYITLYASVGKTFTHDFGQYFEDVDGDPLYIYIPDQADITKLKTKANMIYYPPTRLFSGKPFLEGVFTLLQMRARDSHGAYVTLYWTFKVQKQASNQRVGRLEDQIVTAQMKFFFLFPNDIFFDQLDGSALVLFVSDEKDRSLPDWIGFNPLSRVFQGTAPAQEQSIIIKVTAVQKRIQDKQISRFKLTVVKNNSPKLNIQNMSPDFEIVENTWFQHSLHYNLFSDYESNLAPKISAQGSNGLPLPIWLKFDSFNQTLFGFANQTGVYRIDFIYTDDVGIKTYSNMKIKVLVDIHVTDKKLKMFVLTGAAFFGFMVYFFYAFHFSVMLKQNKKSDRDLEKEASIRAKERFGEYKDVQIAFDFPEEYRVDGMRNAVITRDFDFLNQE